MVTGKPGRLAIRTDDPEEEANVDGTQVQPAADAGRAQIQPSADVDSRATLGPGTTVWHLAQVRENARLGRDCIVGRGAYVGPGVIIGDHVKLQNYALVYEPARLEDGVFIGPAVVLTNDMYPRSTDVAGKLKRPDDWDASGVVVREGASLGARAVVVAGVVIGRAGVPLAEAADGTWLCPQTGESYSVRDGELQAPADPA
jgi:UDP-2-acetamido-3-amino-2,3-dideoxy-glucuronate N-acetyltransferase